MWCPLFSVLVMWFRDTAAHFRVAFNKHTCTPAMLVDGSSQKWRSSPTQICTNLCANDESASFIYLCYFNSWKKIGSENEMIAFMVGGWHPSICIAFFTPLLSILSIRERVGGTGVALLNMSVWFPCQTYWSLSDSGLHKLWSWLRNISGITTVKEADGLWSPLFLPVPRFCQLHLGSVTFSKLLSYKFYTLNCNVAYTHPL